jgi:hypothetical protein
MNDEQPRPTATDDDKFTLTIEDVGNLYAQGGFPRTIRTLQRYCEHGHLDAREKETLLGYMYLVTPESVERHITQLRQFGATTEVATDRGKPRPTAVDVAAKIETVLDHRPSATVDDQARPTATKPARKSPYESQLENENSFLRSQITVKDLQITVLQETVKHIIERDKETNVLMQGFQGLFFPNFLGSNRENSDSNHRPDSATSAS